MKGDDLPQPPVLGCERCGLVSANRLAQPGCTLPCGTVQRCIRCHHALHAFKPLSLQRTWACTIAAAVLYVPANALPVMITRNQFQRDEHTLLGGIHELWVDGSWALAIIVFIASIAVPVLKISGMAMLAWTAQRRTAWRRLDRARLFRLIEAVGHWSMLDVYVVVVLTASIRFGGLASVSPGPGLLSFAGVVILTMLATYSFDPKLMWLDATDVRADRSRTARRSAAGLR